MASDIAATLASQNGREKLEGVEMVGIRVAVIVKLGEHTICDATLHAAKLIDSISCSLPKVVRCAQVLANAARCQDHR